MPQSVTGVCHLVCVDFDAQILHQSCATKFLTLAGLVEGWRR